MRSLKDAFIYQVQAIKAGFSIPVFTANQLIHIYSKHNLLTESQKLFDVMPERNVFSWNAIISAHIKSQNLIQARALFDSASHKDLVTYNSMLSGYISTEGYETNALELFKDMQNVGEKVDIDEFTITGMVKLCAKLLNVGYGRQLHAFMVKTGNDVSWFAVSSLIDLYSKCWFFYDAFVVFRSNSKVVNLVSKNAMMAACCREGEMDMALKIFWKDFELNDVVSWNTLISGYVQNGYEEEGLKLFVSMMEIGFRWNERTFASVLSACANLKSLKLGKEVHAQILKNRLCSDPYLSTGIVDVYCKCGNMKYAESVHLASRKGSPFPVSSMIVGYSSEGRMVKARRLFDSLENKNEVVWTALFSGYVKSWQCQAVFELLNEYIAKEERIPNSLILMSAFGACALQACLNPGKEIHAYVLKMGIEMDKKLISAIVDMYSKCGSISYAERIFERAIEFDSVLYNVVIAGYAHHGEEIKAIHFFDEMLEKGIKPNAVTFIALLSVFRHCGSVEMGEKYFTSMVEDYNIVPEIEHYACMIDLYGRANKLEKAMEFMRRIPTEPDAIIFGAFLNACRLNKNAELAKVAEEKLLRIEGDSGARYVQLANVYAAEEKWDEMGRIRKEMRGKEAKKFAGCSWLYVGSGVRVFTSGDTLHCETSKIYSMLENLNEELYGFSCVCCKEYNILTTNQGIV